MRRKLIKQGVGGATIFLPIGWVRKNNLKAGEEVDVEEKEGNLVISGGKIDTLRALEIDITDLNVSTIRQVIVTAYTGGYAELTVLFKNNLAKDVKQEYIRKRKPAAKVKESLPVKDVVFETIRDLIGYEAVEQKEHKIKIRQISKIDEEEFHATMRRVHLLTQEINSTLVSQMKNGKYDLAEIRSMEHNLKKFINYGMRILNSKIVERNNLDLVTILSRFKRLTHLYYFHGVADLMSGKRPSTFNVTISMFEKMGMLLKSIENTQYGFSYDKYDQFEVMLREVYHIHNTNYADSSKEEIIVRQMLVECCLDLSFMMDSILAMNLNTSSTKG